MADAIISGFAINIFAGLIGNILFAALVVAYHLLRRVVDRQAPGRRPLIVVGTVVLYATVAPPLLFAYSRPATILVLISTAAMISVVIRELWSFWRIGVWGIDRGAATGLGYRKSLELCHDSLEFLGIGAHKLTKETDAFTDAIRRCNRVDRPIRMLLCRPDSADLEDMARQAGTDRSRYQENVRESLRNIRRLRVEQARNIEVRFYSQLPLFRLMFINNEICVASHYIVGEGNGSLIPQLHLIQRVPFSRDLESLYYTLRKYFEQLWKDAEPWDFERFI